MSIYKKIGLSGSANGNFISVNAASSPGVTLHTAVSGTTDTQYDEVWLWAVNASKSALALTIEWGQTTACLEQTIPAESGWSLVVPGLILQNSLVVKAYGGNASQILIGGFCNRILD